MWVEGDDSRREPGLAHGRENGAVPTMNPVEAPDRDCP